MVVVVRVTQDLLLLIPLGDRERLFQDEPTKLLSIVQNTLPESMYRSADVVDMDTRDVFMKQKLKRDGRPSGVWFNIFAVDKSVRLHQALDVFGQFCLATGIAQRREMDETMGLR